MVNSLLKIEQVTPGDRVAEPIELPDGRILLCPGEPIGTRSLSRLRDEGVVRLLIRRPGKGKDIAVSDDEIPYCTSCGMGLALLKPATDRVVQPWNCNGCNAKYYGAFNPNCTGLHCESKRIFCDRTTCGQMSDATQSMVGKLCRIRSRGIQQYLESVSGDDKGRHRGVERRERKRLPLRRFVAVEPRDESYRVIGRSRTATTVDVSTSGLRMVLADTSATNFAVDFTDADAPDLRLILNVVWSKIRDGVLEVGGQFQGRIGVCGAVAVAFHVRQD